MTENNSLHVIMVLAVVLTAVLTYSITKALLKPDPVTTETVTTKIVTVRDTVRRVVYRDRIKATIDTIRIDAGEPVAYKASLDTTLIADNYRIRTQVDYFHPDQLFTIRQNVNVAVDTVYINRDRIITNTIRKTNWTATAIGTALGITGGFVLHEYIRR